ncbi:hypothetical protein, partial [uncultured Bilophila sp.]
LLRTSRLAGGFLPYKKSQQLRVAGSYAESGTGTAGRQPMSSHSVNTTAFKTCRKIPTLVMAVSIIALFHTK